MSTEQISKIFILRIDNTDDIDSLQKELLILQRIERDIDDKDVKEEMHMKIGYVKRRIVDLREQQIIRNKEGNG